MNLPNTATQPVSPQPATTGLALAAGFADGLGLRVMCDAYGPLIVPQSAEAASIATANLPGAGVLPPAAPVASVDWNEPQLCALAEYGLITVTGAESIKFLNSQLTNDVSLLASDALQLNGYCTPKGRLLASLIEWGDDQGRSLAIARDLAAPIAKRLSMYVMRTKAKVVDESAGWMALGLMGSDLAPILARIDLNVPGPMQRVGGGGKIALGLAAVSAPGESVTSTVASTGESISQTVQRVMLWLAADQAVAAVQALGVPLTSPQSWRYGEVAAGTARITLATSEAFVPQMINFDLIAGVSFKKGCYPGQEIVARTHYLGKLKRRTLRGEVNASGQPGDDIVIAATGEPCGKLLLSAQIAPNRYSILFEVQMSAAESGGLFIAGQPITLQALPYPVTAG